MAWLKWTLKWTVVAAALMVPLACGDDDGDSDAACGPSTCAATEYCCDVACGLCAAEGTACSVCP
jgi:hypothetical protein